MVPANDLAFGLRDQVNFGHDCEVFEREHRAHLARQVPPSHGFEHDGAERASRWLPPLSARSADLNGRAVRRNGSGAVCIVGMTGLVAIGGWWLTPIPAPARLA
jgi:hypothetical protein